MIHDAEIEARLLVACIEEPHILEAVDELEIQDFWEYANQAAFTAVRNVQAAHVPMSIIAIDDELLRRDRVRDTCVAEKAGITYLRHLLETAKPYGPEGHNAAIADQRRLRALRALREQHRTKAAIEVLTPDKPDADTARAAAEPSLAVQSAAGWSNMPTRVVKELDDRKWLAARALSYHNTFLDDQLRAILPHDLILIGAPTGLGKTDLALSIAMKNAMSERHVAYFALEAEPRELERRTKFSWLSRQVHARNLPDKNEFNFTDWLLCKCEHIVGSLNEECERWFLNNLGGFWTYYRGSKFDQKDLCREILKVHGLVDLIVIDHLHYVDIEEGENESAGLGETMKAIRDLVLRIGKPIILVAHLRKKDERLKKIVPVIGDFHGSSNITKIATQAITLERASKVQAPSWYLSPTYLSVIKDRRAGEQPYVALQFFDRRSRSYETDYVIGRVIKGNTDWEPVKPGDQPSWARGHRQLELEFV